MISSAFLSIFNIYDKDDSSINVNFLLIYLLSSKFETSANIDGLTIKFSFESVFILLLFSYK